MTCREVWLNGLWLGSVTVAGFSPIELARTHVVSGPSESYMTQTWLQSLPVKVFFLLSCDSTISVCGWENATWDDGFVYSLTFGGKRATSKLFTIQKGLLLLLRRLQLYFLAWSYCPESSLPSTSNLFPPAL